MKAPVKSQNRSITAGCRSIQLETQRTAGPDQRFSAGGSQLCLEGSDKHPVGKIRKAGVGSCARKTTHHWREMKMDEVKGLEAFDWASVSKFMCLWQDWWRQVKGERTRCQRHHLREILARVQPVVIVMVVALARIGKGDVSACCREALADTVRFLESRTSENVIYEYYSKFGELVEGGKWLVLEAEEALAESVVALEPENSLKPKMAKEQEPEAA